MKMSKVRLCGCQGPSHLIPLLAFLESRGSKTDRNILVIYDLFAEQEKGLADILQRLAGKARPWERTVFWGKDYLKHLESRVYSESLFAVEEDVRRDLGPSVDEVVLPGHWSFGAKVLLWSYPSSRKTRYGDGIGFDFNESFLLPEQDLVSRKWRGDLLSRIRYGLKKKGAVPPLPSFDENVFWESSSWEDQLMDLGRLYLDLGPPPSWGDAVVLLSSHFSPWRMEESQEFAAYYEFLESRVSSDLPLVVKPHPREDAQKGQRMKHYFSKRGRQLEVLEGIAGWPAEVLLEATRTQGHSFPKEFISFGASTLGLRKRFSGSIHCGFGEALVHKYFRPEHCAPRLHFERFLQESP